MSENKKKLIGSIQEDLKKPESEGPRKEIRFLEPDGQGDSLYYPGYMNEMNGTQEVNSTPIRVYPKPFEKDGQTHVRLIVRKMLTAPQPAKNSSGLFVDGQGNVVENKSDAAQVNRAITYKGTNRKVFVTLGEYFTANSSHKGTPYGQTMVVGKSFDEEAAKDIERNLYKAGNLKAANKEADAQAVYDQVNQMKKDKGSYTSMFINKNLAAEFATRFKASMEVSQSQKYDPKDNDIPF